MDHPFSGNDRGDWQAADAAAIYAELRRIASSTRKRGAQDTLGTTALVHEAFVKISGSLDGLDGEKHFYVLASKAMRQILVDYARHRRRAKRTPVGERIPLDDVFEDMGRRHIDLIALDDALGRLAEFDPRKARVVELRFFGGLDIARVAEVLGVGHATVERDWRLARAWLRKELDDGELE